MSSAPIAGAPSNLNMPLSLGGREFQRNPWWTAIVGVNPSGQPVILALNADGSIPTSGDSVTSNFESLGASGSFTIPAGAKGWTVSFLSGTGTIGGVAVSVGFSDSSPAVAVAAIVVTTGAASSAYIRYGS